MSDSRWKFVVLRKKFTIFSPFFGVRACALTMRLGVWGPLSSRCSEMHSQPYLSSKWVIPDENSSSFEKTIYLFHPFLVCRPVCLWHNAIAAGGLGAAEGLIWDPFFWCAGLSGRSPIIFFHGVRAQLFFSLIIRAQFSFFKEFQGTIIIFNSIHVPPPPPWISNGQFLSKQREQR